MDVSFLLNCCIAFCIERNLSSKHQMQMWISFQLSLFYRIWDKCIACFPGSEPANDTFLYLQHFLIGNKSTDQKAYWTGKVPEVTSIKHFGTTLWHDLQQFKWLFWFLHTSSIKLKQCNWKKAIFTLNLLGSFTQSAVLWNTHHSCNCY